MTAFVLQLCMCSVLSIWLTKSEEVPAFICNLVTSLVSQGVDVGHKCKSSYLQGRGGGLGQAVSWPLAQQIALHQFTVTVASKSKPDSQTLTRERKSDLLKSVLSMLKACL